MIGHLAETVSLIPKFYCRYDLLQQRYHLLKMGRSLVNDVKYYRWAISLFEVWREQMENAYFKLGNLLSAETQLNSLPNLKYTLACCSCNTSNKLIVKHNAYGKENFSDYFPTLWFCEKYWLRNRFCFGSHISAYIKYMDDLPMLTSWATLVDCSQVTVIENITRSLSTLGLAI